MLKKLASPLVGGVSLIVLVIVMFCSWQGAGSNFTHGYGDTPYWRWLGDLLLFFSPVCLIAGAIAGFLVQYGARRLKTGDTSLQRVWGIAALLFGILVWVDAAGYILVGASLLATG